MTTEEFEKFLRENQEGLEITEEKILRLLETHKKVRSGEISLERFKNQYKEK